MHSEVHQVTLLAHHRLDIEDHQIPLFSSWVEQLMYALDPVLDLPVPQSKATRSLVVKTTCVSVEAYVLGKQLDDPSYYFMPRCG